MVHFIDPQVDALKHYFKKEYWVKFLSCLYDFFRLFDIVKHLHFKLFHVISQY